MLRQAFAHCGKFLAAASRRSWGRVSVPMWLIILSDQRPIIALVSRHLTNELIGRRPLVRRALASPFLSHPTRSLSSCGITSRFRKLSPTRRQVAHGLLTRPPRKRSEDHPVRLACIRHAASVDPEPGSNSPSKTHQPVAQPMSHKSVVAPQMLRHPQHRRPTLPHYAIVNVHPTFSCAGQGVYLATAPRVKSGPVF